MSIFNFNLLGILGILLLMSFVHEREDSPSMMLDQVNDLRSQGCYCGREFMPPVKRLKWNSVLYQSALDHAIEMEKYDYFSHYSKDGLDIGKRMDKYDYPWHFVGENIAEGQKTFKEVFKDWKKSRTHCEMMMNPKMEEMAIARHEDFWVQHFGKKIPKGAKKKK